MRKIKTLIFSILLLLIFNFGAVFAQAEGILPTGTGNASCPTDGSVTGATNCGNYSINDFLMLGIKLSEWILGIIGSIALLFFIYGGFTFILSGGSSDRVDKGKKIIINSIIGLILVFTSFLIIRFSMSAMGLNWDGTSKTPQNIGEQKVVTPEATNKTE